MYWRYAEFHDMTEDIIINDCSGLNVRPDTIRPIYQKIGKGKHAKAEVLFDVEFFGPNCGCSFYNCGVEPARSAAELTRRIDEIIAYWSSRDDPHGIADRYREIKESDYVFKTTGLEV